MDTIPNETIYEIAIKLNALSELEKFINSSKYLIFHISNIAT